MNDDEIWADDQFDRRQIANDLIDFVRSRYSTGAVLGEARAQVIAVDAEYGIGKTFFLTRLAKQLEQDSAVAYIDAWSDDYVGEPLISLAATIREALPDETKDNSAGERWNSVASKVGKVAWIAAKGLGLQAAKAAISGGAVASIEGVLGEDAVDGSTIRDGIEAGLPAELPDLTEEQGGAFLASEIAKYQQSRKAVEELRDSLAELAKTVEEDGRVLPIFIIVDELDRCRPDYAIKTLEQIKHVFGVREFCFILGMNSEQLSASVSHEYGSDFSGADYLDRFIDRKLRLPFPKLNAICKALYTQVTEGDKRELWFAQATRVDNSRISLTGDAWVASLLEHYQISPRGIFKFFERLQSALALIDTKVVNMNYLCEIIAEDVGGKVIKTARPWEHRFNSGFGERPVEYSGAAFFDAAKAAYQGGDKGRKQVYNSDTPIDGILGEFFGLNDRPGAEDYHLVIQRLADLSSPYNGPVVV